MDERLQEMLDHYEITKTLSQYCHGCDRCDEERMANVYLDDSWDDHGDVEAPGPEFARIMTARIQSTTKTLSHMLGQSQIKVDGDEAGAETYFLAAFLTTRDGVEICNQLGGRFVDKLQRVDGRWRIKHRIAMRDWSISLPVEHDYVAHSQLTEGSRSNADPSFAVLGLIHSAARSRA